MTKKNEALEPVGATDLATLDMFEAHAGEGLENIGKDQMSMPILKLLQSNSPEIQRGNEKFIDGARAGDFVNSLTGELYDGQEGLYVTQFHFTSNVVEWVPRDLGGGYVAAHANKQEALKNQREGTDLVDTFNHYLFVSKDRNQWTPVLFPSKSTNLKFSRKFNTLMSNAVIRRPDGRTFTPPTYAKFYHLVSAVEKNPKGSYFVAKFQLPAGAHEDPNANVMTDRTLVETIETFRAGALRGDVEIDMTEGAVEPTVEDDDIKF
jgi:hypothetical protein